MTATDGSDMTEMILNNSVFTFLLISKDISQADPEALIAANNIAMNCQSGGCAFYCITSSLQPDIDRVSAEINPVFEFLTADQITLKTILRSNPGLMLLKDGTIMAKWHANDFPEVTDINKNFLAKILDKQRERSEHTLILLLISVFVLLILAISSIVPRKKT